MISALVRQIDGLDSLIRIKTVYVGGGSPSFLDLTYTRTKDLNGFDFCENRGGNMLTLGLRA